jgi:hypothetical protein
MRASEDLRSRDRSARQRREPDEVDSGTTEVDRLISLPELEGHPAHERRPWRQSDLSVHLAEEGWGWLQDEEEIDDCLLKGGWSMPRPDASGPEPW